jgi:hypothetical protein
VQVRTDPLRNLIARKWKSVGKHRRWHLSPDTIAQFEIHPKFECTGRYWLRAVLMTAFVAGDGVDDVLAGAVCRVSRTMGA